MRALTFALTQPDTERAALAALEPGSDVRVVEALLEVLAREHAAPLTPKALNLLALCDHPLVEDGLIAALDSPLVTVRLPAVEALASRKVFRAAGRLVEMLGQDDTWMVRRAVVRALAGHLEPVRWQILLAADDPHWRVRHALIRVLLDWGQETDKREEIDRRLAELPPHSRIEGVRGYIQARWTGSSSAAGLDEQNPPWPFWDPDPAVLVRKLEEMGESGRRKYLDAMPVLLSHEADRARSLAVETLRKRGETVHLAMAVAQLEDPRIGAGASVGQVLKGIDLDRIEETARYILHMERPSAAQLAWAIEQAGPVFPPEEEADVLRALLETAARYPTRVRRALDQLGERWLGAPVAGGKEEDPTARANDPDSRVRQALAESLIQNHPASPLIAKLQTDPHPLVRAAALTPERAAELIAHPEQETSWHVLACAARMQKTPLWRLEPQPSWQSPPKPAVVAEPLSPSFAAPLHPRPLGSQMLLVAPIGISGHYGLPVEGFVRAVEAGVNLLFWEPNYQTLTAFSGRLSPAQRRQVNFLVGTFEASGPRIRKDVERALRNLKIERISLFMIFWTRTWERITDEVRDTMERLQQAGLIGMAGLSTHSRTLAVEAMAGGWNPVMVRHSAAHRGAETQVLPHAQARQTSLITFNNTCYGRLLKPQGTIPPPSAADCYRYTLSFPQVTMCLSAPATMEQLDENLQALRDPHLPDERRLLLLEQGAEVYKEETLFRRLVRSR
jgi:hypothetical protein